MEISKVKTPLDRQDHSGVVDGETVWVGLR